MYLREAHKKTFGLAVAAGFFILAPHLVHAATQIYYSVGQNVSDHKSCTASDCTANPLTVSIDGSGAATFSAAQTATNMGIGDIVNYGGTSGRVFITGKTSTSVWSVRTATGTLPLATTSATVGSITHAFASLNAAVGVPGTATSSSFLNTTSLVTGDFVLNLPLYYDGSADTSRPYIDGITTDTSHYLRIYTPTSTVSEVNASQRHPGMYTSTKWRLESNASFQDIMRVSIMNVRLDGLQVRNTASNSGADGVRFSITNTSPNGDLYISNNIIWDAPYEYGLVFPSFATTITGNIYIWNNVIKSGGLMGGLSIAVSWNARPFYVYNNTFYDNLVGILVSNSQATGIFKNNLFASTSYSFSMGGKVQNGSDYNSTASTSLDYIVTGGGNTHDRLSQTISFTDPSADYRLAATDTGARDVGVSLSSDANLPFNTDIEGESRPFNSLWDIGADEYVNQDVTPPNLSGEAPSGALATSTTSTNLAVTTNEAATCKYDTTPNVAYASMASTFTTTGSISHSTPISGLSSGHVYTYYVRCQDTSGNPTTSDDVITFNVGTNGTAYADTCSLTDVQAAMNIAVPGDTVSIPAGTCSWGDGGSHFSVNKAVTVQGAGRGQTNIMLAASGPKLANATISITAPATFKSMTIDATTTEASTTTAFAVGANGFHITDIQYNPSGIMIGYFLYGAAGGSYGLLDNSDITAGGGTDELIFVRGPVDSWQTPNSMGSSSALFIENSTFNGFGYVTDCNANSRCVVRNLTVTGLVHIDGHGPASNSPFRGVRQYELYNNAFTGNWTTQAVVDLQGGTGMVFNNSVPNVTGTNYAWFYLTNLAYAGGTFSNFNNNPQCPSDYPSIDQIGVGMDPKAAASEPYYVWGNTRGGIFWPLNKHSIDSSALTYCFNTYGDPPYDMETVIRYDRDYYVSSTTPFTGASGVGEGTLAQRPSTCTPHVGYWATDQGGSWDTSNGTSADGALYKCTAPDTWTLSYIPYAYPHYLTAASTTNTDQVDIGAGARMFGNGTFYGFSTSTASGVKATLGITMPDTSSPDYWVDVTISKWDNSGVREKTWTESSTNLYSTSTLHTVGDLSPDTDYDVKVDGSIGSAVITGSSCTAGICTSDGTGTITFTYTGGYTSHTFDVQQSAGPVPPATIPTVSTSAASSISATGAVLNGSIDSTGGADASESGFAYGTDSTLSSVIATSTLGAQTGTASFSQTLSTLTCATAYYFRAYATNTAGTGYGSIQTFSTSDCDVTPPPPPPAPVVMGGGGGGWSGSVPYVPSSSYMVTLINPVKTTAPKLSGLVVSIPVITVSASPGSTGLHVSNIQKAMNALGFTVAKTGPGSPGNETTFFGALTRKAVKSFQIYYKIAFPGDPGFGYVGPLTRAKLNSLLIRMR